MSNTPKRKRGGDKPEKLSVEKYAAALTASAGVVSTAAKKLKVTRGTVYNAIIKHPELASIREEAREAILDMAESNLFLAIELCDIRAITWFLARQGKHRGYGARTEVTGPGGGPLQHDIRSINVTMQYRSGGPDPDR